MSEKIFYTKWELIEEWLKYYPDHKDDPDLEFNAMAGYVGPDEKGLYIKFSQWQPTEGDCNAETNR